MAVRPNKPGDHRTYREPVPENAVTAAKTAKSEHFIKLCQQHDVKPTKRQAAAYNARRGRWQEVT
jgi:hypothetical protein